MDNKNYAVLRVEKIKSLAGLAGRARHNLRQGETPHADRTRSNILRGPSTVSEITQAWKDKTDGLKIKENAVLAVEYVLTTTHEFWETATSQQKKDWANRSLEFVQKKHGAENILSSALHRDEVTPHWHILVVPIDTKPRVDKKTEKSHAFRGLNASAFFDGVRALSKLQDDYHAVVGDLGLERGVKGSKARHTTTKAFQKALNRADKPLPVLTKADHAAAAMGIETPALKARDKAVAALQMAAKAPQREQSALRKVKELAKAKAEAEKELAKAKDEAEKERERANARTEALRRKNIETESHLALTRDHLLEQTKAVESLATELQYLKQKGEKVLPFVRPKG